jgi:hypothetical protein
MNEANATKIIPLDLKRREVVGVKMVKFGNLTDTFKMGVRAYVEGVNVKSNPYKYGSQEWDDWKDGHGFCKAVALCNLMLNELEDKKK